ncbi:MAG: hypothetical protein ACMUHM_01945 [Thermoplasmatota archaeon]
MTGENVEKCPVCGNAITERLTIGARFTCIGCRSEFLVKWNRDKRDYRYVNLADRGKGEPLRLPRGSVRALLLISISLICWVLLIWGREVPNYLLNLVLVMIGYYFAFRVAQPSKATSREVVDKEAKHPLHLPRGYVRWIVVGGFMIALVVLVATGRIARHDHIEFYFILTGLVIGYLARKTRSDWLKFETPVFFKHAKALLLLLIAAFLMVLFFGGLADMVHPLPIRLSIAVIGFYFGSRD